MCVCVWGGGVNAPSRLYFTHIVNQRWTKSGVPGEKPHDLLLQNLASHMGPESGSNHSGERRLN